MKNKRPYIITLIGDVNFLCALLLLASLFPGFLEQFNFSINEPPVFVNKILRLLYAIILLIASYGFLKLKKWGFWLMAGYSIFFLVCVVFSLQSKYPVNFSNIINTIIELIFIFLTKKYFYEKAI